MIDSSISEKNYNFFLHGIRKSNIDDFVTNRLNKVTKGIFLFNSFSNYSYSSILFTLQVVIFHSIGLSGWSELKLAKLSNQHIDDSIVIVLGKFLNGLHLKKEVFQSYSKNRDKKNISSFYYVRIRDIGLDINVNDFEINCKFTFEFNDIIKLIKREDIFDTMKFFQNVVSEKQNVICMESFNVCKNISKLAFSFFNKSGYFKKLQN